MDERFYYKESYLSRYKRWRVYDRTVDVGKNHMCTADCLHEYEAFVIVHERNQGLPYRPDITYEDYLKIRQTYFTVRDKK